MKFKYFFFKKKEDTSFWVLSSVILKWRSEMWYKILKS